MNEYSCIRDLWKRLRNNRTLVSPVGLYSCACGMVWVLYSSLQDYSTRQLILKHPAPHQISTLPPTTSTLNCAIITSLIRMKIASFNSSWFILSCTLILRGYICLIILIFYMLATCYNISLYPRRYTSI